MKHTLTCVECPMGCEIEVVTENGAAVSVTGNSCPRGKAYAENEVVCPKRVLTTTVRMTDGRMLPVKTNQPVKKAELLALMQTINGVHPTAPVRIGDVLMKNISDGADLIAADNME
ncbi:MAG: DUF1667 domain-containing protein [Clostridia bacterium]|nr:DUF1667 domain-containing protein [Clostridia bacterium]